MNLRTADVINAETDWEVNMFCAICVQKLQKKATKSITTLLDNSIKAYEFLEVLSKFKFMINGPQLVCTSCFDKILVAFKLHKMCNQAQEQFEQYLTYCENLNSQCEDSINESTEIQNNDTDVIEIKVEIDMEETNIQVSNNQRMTSEEMNVINKRWNNDRIRTKRRYNLAKKLEEPGSIYQCNICLKTFSGSYKRDYHIRCEHTGEKTFVCDICGDSFFLKNKLAAHQLKHVTSRPWECKLCPKKFKTEIHLSRHVKTHSEERNFKCSKCDSSFKHKKSLKIHELIHEHLQFKENM